MHYKIITSPDNMYSSFYAYFVKKVYIKHLHDNKEIIIKPHTNSYVSSYIDIVFTNDSTHIILLPTLSNIILLYDMNGNLTNTIEIDLYKKNQYMEYSIILSLFESYDTFICSTCSKNIDGDIIEDKKIITFNKDIFRKNKYQLLTSDNILNDSYDSFFVDMIKMIKYNSEYILYGFVDNMIHVFTPELNIIYSIIYEKNLYLSSIDISYDAKYFVMLDSYSHNIILWKNGILINKLKVNIYQPYYVKFSPDGNYIFLKMPSLRERRLTKINIYNIKIQLLCNMYVDPTIKSSLICPFEIKENYKVFINNNYNNKMLTNSPLTLFSTFKETILNNDWDIIIPEEIFEKIFKFFCFLNLI